MVKSYRLQFRPSAKADLEFLYDFIADQSGAAIAARYIGRITLACRMLKTFPLRGTERSDVGPGVRTMGFERRAVILFSVNERTVKILRIFYGGQDVEKILRSQKFD